MSRILTYLVLAIAITTGSNAFADEGNISFESVVYSGFKTIDRFGMINVNLGGSAEKIGLKKVELTDYLRLRFKNNFSGISFKEPEDFAKLLQDKEMQKKIGTIHVKVWTVGDEFPIAYHIAINSGNFERARQYETAILGYGSKRNVPESVRQSITELVEELAVAFFKARGEL